MQSDELRVVVGETEKAFSVPRDLFSKCSHQFKFMCFGDVVEVELLGVDPATFGSFLVWLHSWLPNGIVDETAEKTVDLAIFAEKYEVSALLLQCLHVLKETWGFHKAGHTSQKWTVERSKAASPRVIRRIFEKTKDTSALRDMCASFLGGYTYSKKWCPISINEYETVFEDLPDLGWRVFQNQVQYCKWPAMPRDYQTVYGCEDETDLAHQPVNLGRKNWTEIQENLGVEQDGGNDSQYESLVW